MLNNINYGDKAQLLGALESLENVAREIKRGTNINQLRLHLGREIADLQRAWEIIERREATVEASQNGARH